MGDTSEKVGVLDTVSSTLRLASVTRFCVKNWAGKVSWVFGFEIILFTTSYRFRAGLGETP